MNMRTCIYVAGILGLAITVTQTGIGSTVGEGLLHIMPLDADRPFTSFGADGDHHGAQLHYDRQWRSGAVHHAGAELLGRDRLPAAVGDHDPVLGYSTPLLPYQASPIVVAMGLGKVPAKAGMLLCGAGDCDVSGAAAAGLFVV